MQEEESKKPKKPLIYYYIVVFCILLLLNALVFPSVMQKKVTETTYNAFLDAVDEGKVSEVYMEDGQILYSTKGENGDGAVFKTGIWPDDTTLSERLRKAGVNFATPIPTQSSPLLNFILTWIFPILMFVVLGQLMTRMLTKRMGAAGNALTLGKSNAKIYAEDQTGITFADVAGQDEAKEALTEIVDFLHNPGKYSEIGAILPKGALLVGPPGTGKTLLARAVAGEAKVPFFSISGSEFVEMFVGMGAAKVRDLFKQAGEKRRASSLSMKLTP